MVDARTNRTTGMIQGATMKQDDRRVYVVGGNLVQYADGSGIDNRASDGSIIVRDAETGHEQWIDTSSKALRNAHHAWWMERQEKLNDIFTRSNVDSVSVRTDQDYVKALMNLFAKRN